MFPKLLSQRVCSSVSAAVFGDYFLKRAHNRAPLVIAQQYFDAALRLIQAFLTLARQANAVLEKFQTLFQRQVAAFEFMNDFFQGFERRLKTFWLLLIVFHLCLA